jgi:DNA-binding transcriptional ArsR family regulator
MDLRRLNGSQPNMRSVPKGGVGVAEAALQIDRPDAAAVFSDPRRRRLILEFAKGPKTMKEMSAATGMQLSLLNYHVRRLQELGLLRFVRAEPRAGAAIKFYEAVARAFFVPSYLASNRPSHQLTNELRAALERAEMESNHVGTLYFLDGERGPRIRHVGGLAGNAAAHLRVLRLTDAGALALAGDMATLLAKYEGDGGASAKPFLAVCALAPRPL